MDTFYFVSVEPVYSQGVGNYALYTSNAKNANKLLKEQQVYKDKILKNTNDEEDMMMWEFYECVYKITNGAVSIYSTSYQLSTKTDENINVETLEYKNSEEKNPNLDWELPIDIVSDGVRGTTSPISEFTFIYYT
jgi:hypothetical protein